MDPEKIAHEHQIHASHAIDRQRRFFALAAGLKLDPNETKNKAVKYCKVDCFNKITGEQLDKLIRSLVSRTKKQIEEEQRNAKS